VNASEWGLSEAGKQQAEEMSQLPLMQAVDALYVSEEPKTSATAAPLVNRLHKELTVSGAFNEVRRGDKFLTKEEFEAEKVKQLSDVSYPAFDGETGMQALERFKDGVAQVVAEHEGETVLIVTHGTILNIYFADLLSAYDKLPARWQKTGFCAYGIVEDGKVVRDIIYLDRNRDDGILKL